MSIFKGKCIIYGKCLFLWENAKPLVNNFGTGTVKFGYWNGYGKFFSWKKLISEPIPESRICFVLNMNANPHDFDG